MKKILRLLGRLTLCFGVFSISSQLLHGQGGAVEFDDPGVRYAPQSPPPSKIESEPPSNALMEQAFEHAQSYVIDQITGFVTNLEEKLMWNAISNTDGYQALTPDEQNDVKFTYDWTKPSLFIPGSDTALQNFEQDTLPAMNAITDTDPGDGQ